MSTYKTADHMLIELLIDGAKYSIVHSGVQERIAHFFQTPIFPKRQLPRHLLSRRPEQAIFSESIEVPVAWCAQVMRTPQYWIERCGEREAQLLSLFFLKGT
jgi:hypothetical protein